MIKHCVIQVIPPHVMMATTCTNPLYLLPASSWEDDCNDQDSLPTKTYQQPTITYAFPLPDGLQLSCA